MRDSLTHSDRTSQNCEFLQPCTRLDIFLTHSKYYGGHMIPLFSYDSSLGILISLQPAGGNFSLQEVTLNKFCNSISSPDPNKLYIAVTGATGRLWRENYPLLPLFPFATSTSQSIFGRNFERFVLSQKKQDIASSVPFGES